LLASRPGGQCCVVTCCQHATRPAESETRSWQLPIVIDSSALVEMLLRMPRGVALTELLTGEEKVAPDLIGVETVSTLRRLEHQGDLDPDRAKDAPVQTVKTAGLLERAWELRHNLSAYDAAYLALAEDLGCELATLDDRLSRAPGLPVKVRPVK
jgi:predicted nucleic acid-binding protein